MTDRLDLFFRAQTVPAPPQKEYRAKRHATQPKNALIFRCATGNDEKKDLLFGAYVCAEREGAEYIVKEIGLFYPGGLPEAFRPLTRFVKGSAYEIGTVDQFRRNVFLKYLQARALIVAYDAPTRDKPDRDQMEQVRESQAGVLVLFPDVPGPQDRQNAAQRIRTWDFD